MSRDDAYLLDMLRFVREVLEFARGVTEEQYLSDIEKRSGGRSAALTSDDGSGR
jgi:uncharacterized protein with HEPN domain